MVSSTRHVSVKGVLWDPRRWSLLAIVRVVKGEGMPKSKQPGQKGDMRIVFDVQVRMLDSSAPTCFAARHLCFSCAQPAA